jgi:hypothetical protein
MIMMMFWVLAPCRFVGRCQHFGEISWLHRQGRRWRQYVSPKPWHLPTNLHGAKTENIVIVVIVIVIIIILTAVTT